MNIQTNACIHKYPAPNQHGEKHCFEILLIKHGVCATNKEQYKNNKAYLYHKKKYCQNNGINPPTNKSRQPLIVRIIHGHNLNSTNVKQVIR